MNATAKKTEPARSRSRIGSDEARLWVRKLRLGNPYAKSILMAVANYMNEEGGAYPGIATLHLDTDIAEDTIVSRLRWCESIGAIALFKCWVDENGRRNYDGRGRVTSSEIRFLFDADLDGIEANAIGSTRPRALRGAALASHETRAANPRPDGEQGDETSPRHGREPDQVSPGVAPDQPPPPAPRIEEQKNQDSPPCPPSGGLALQSNDCEGWEEFKGAFEGDGEPIIRVSIAKQLFEALSPDERKRVTKAAKGLIVFRAKQKKPAAKPSAQTFIREIDAWVTWAAHAPSEAKPLVKATIARDAPAWQGLCVVKRIWSAPDPTGDVEVQEVAIPYLESLAGLFEFVGPWRVIRIRDDHKQAKAWEERLGRCGFRMPASQRLKLLEEGARDAEGRTTRLARYLEGWLLPLGWPPRMDGTLSTTGPPTQSLMTSEDEEVVREGL